MGCACLKSGSSKEIKSIFVLGLPNSSNQNNNIHNQINNNSNNENNNNQSNRESIIFSFKLLFFIKESGNK
jgi:hypothetical protein